MLFLGALSKLAIGAFFLAISGGFSQQVSLRHPTSRPETVKSIKERGIHAYPELLPPGKREKRDINDLDVIAECVGLRTTRKGGVRIDTTSLGTLSIQLSTPRLTES